MASFDTSKIVSDIKAGKITSKEPPKYIFVKNPRNNRKIKKLNPRWTAWSKKQKGKKIDKKVETYVQKNKGKNPINKDLTIDNSKKKKVVKKTDNTKNTQQTDTPTTTVDKPKGNGTPESKKEKKSEKLKIKKGSARNWIKGAKGKMYRRGTPMAKRAEERERKRKALAAKGYMKR